MNTEENLRYLHTCIAANDAHDLLSFHFLHYQLLVVKFNITHSRFLSFIFGSVPTYFRRHFIIPSSSKRNKRIKAPSRPAHKTKLPNCGPVKWRRPVNMFGWPLPGMEISGTQSRQTAQESAHSVSWGREFPDAVPTLSSLNVTSPLRKLNI